MWQYSMAVHCVLIDEYDKKGDLQLPISTYSALDCGIEVHCITAIRYSP